VAVLDGTAYGIEGIQGVAKGPSANRGSGFIDVELPNKTVVPIAANLLLPPLTHRPASSRKSPPLHGGLFREG